ncbi:MerR family transcriptional regulator [Nocardia sp. CDC159]|uniref:MerR family transcriptional regulator n=1 Tax=Nocardia pulmonis TaxID=2951408 RepID=A0A9X2E1U2_9NOCA|nr:MULTISPECIES: MerR family transcriptional regulator [Nocardia]MCM6772025.1 MerR family transcriptional regulator [Nocardia pulmonis]MCM6785317.1 MerR family transcriptional regulator [Nocardia sp. CDC159]
MTTPSHPERALKVGELAAATGLTVRTLHHYDEIGLLSPAGRTSTGHRLYSTADVERLYRIGLLRQLGLRLDEVAAALDDPRWDLRATMSRHIDRLDHRLGIEHRLRNRLAAMAETLSGPGGPDVRELLDTLEDMAMLDTTIRRRIPTLVYRDIAAAHEFLCRAFGFEPGRLARAEDGTVVHGELTAGDGVIWLHQVSERFALASPASVGVCTEGMSIVVDDVDAHHRHAADAGAEILYPPTDQSYGYRDYSARDPEQRLWTFMTPLT